jgi:hypothetical protein
MVLDAAEKSPAAFNLKANFTMMTKIQRYPNLAILPAEKICLHEHHDPQRTKPLMERIRESGILYNPPLVIPYPNGEDMYMVLDGANRVTSMKELGLPHLLVQVVDPHSPGVSLQTWNHVIWEIATDDLIQKIVDLGDLDVVEISGQEFHPRSIALFQTPWSQHYSINSNSTESRSEKITQLVKMYSREASFDRTMIDTIDNLNGFYNELAGLVIYPPFEIEEVVQFCRDDSLLPAGVTRFIVSPRALRVNYPLDCLARKDSLEEKQARLDNFIQERMENKGVRIYTETTVLYDE